MSARCPIPSLRAKVATRKGLHHQKHGESTQHLDDERSSHTSSLPPILHEEHYQNSMLSIDYTGNFSRDTIYYESHDSILSLELTKSVNECQEIRSQMYKEQHERILLAEKFNALLIELKQTKVELQERMSTLVQEQISMEECKELSMNMKTSQQKYILNERIISNLQEQCDHYHTVLQERQSDNDGLETLCNQLQEKQGTLLEEVDNLHNEIVTMKRVNWHLTLEKTDLEDVVITKKRRIIALEEQLNHIADCEHFRLLHSPISNSHYLKDYNMAQQTLPSRSVQSPNEPPIASQSDTAHYSSNLSDHISIDTAHANRVDQQNTIPISSRSNQEDTNHDQQYNQFVARVNQLANSMYVGIPLTTVEETSFDD